MSNKLKLLQDSLSMSSRHEIRAFWTSETTHFAVEQPSINLRVSVRQPLKNRDRDLQKYANCFCAQRIK